VNPSMLRIFKMFTQRKSIQDKELTYDNKKKCLQKNEKYTRNSRLDVTCVVM
jgi:hypothetical protein